MSGAGVAVGATSSSGIFMGTGVAVGVAAAPPSVDADGVADASVPVLGDGSWAEATAAAARKSPRLPTMNAVRNAVRSAARCVARFMSSSRAA
jgi:hypothetical protein